MQWNILGHIFYLSKTTVSLLIAVLVIGLIVGGYFFMPKETVVPASYTPSAVGTELPQPTVTLSSTPKPVYWRVYIVGAVKMPGLYTLQEGALVYDAVSAAGGLLETVETSSINLAQELAPNFMIRILTEKERREQGRVSGLILIRNNVEVSGDRLEEQGTADTGKGEPGKVNINLATKEELMTLPGIGAARAESIIAYREEKGVFQTPEEIMSVSGIKESAFAKIKDRITT